jgi:hypothetical protein
MSLPLGYQDGYINLFMLTPAITTYLIVQGAIWSSCLELNGQCPVLFVW